MTLGVEDGVRSAAGTGSGPATVPPPPHPAQFHTVEAVLVPHSQLSTSREESCWASRRPTHHVAHRWVLVQWGIGFILEGTSTVPSGTDPSFEHR